MTTPIGSKLQSITVAGKIIDVDAIDLAEVEMSALGVPAARIVVGQAMEGDDLILVTLANDGTMEAMRFRGAQQPKVFTRRSAISTNGAFPVSVWNAGQVSQTDVVPVKGGGVDRHIGFWQPADQLEVTIIKPFGADVNLRNRFANALPIQVGGFDGYYWGSRAAIPAAQLGRNWLVDTAGAEFPPFPRRVASKLPADADNPDVAQVWVPSDFTSADDSSVAYGAHIADVTRVSASPTERYHKAYWVPDDKPDIDDLLQADERGQQPGLAGGTGFSFLYEKQAGTVTVDGVVGKVWGTTRVLHPFDPATLAYAYLLIIQTPEA